MSKLANLFAIFSYSETMFGELNRPVLPAQIMNVKTAKIVATSEISAMPPVLVVMPANLP